MSYPLGFPLVTSNTLIFADVDRIDFIREGRRVPVDGQPDENRGKANDNKDNQEGVANPV